MILPFALASIVAFAFAFAFAFASVFVVAAAYQRVRTARAALASSRDTLRTPSIRFGEVEWLSMSAAARTSRAS